MTAKVIPLPRSPSGPIDPRGPACAACGTYGLAGNRHCVACGAALPVVCSQCPHLTPPEARFCGGCGSALRPVAVPAALSACAAERRHLTVMFCDVVGSTALAARLDPEELHEVIAAYGRAVAEAVSRLDGFISHYMGDGVLACFGYPRPRPDDAERAVRAGLALIRAVARLNTREPLQIRVGVATGLVVVGALVSEGDLRMRPILGVTPNLAARLQGVARPGTIAISAATRRSLGHAFDCEDLGAVELRGFQQPSRAWLVRGEARPG